MIDNRNTRMMPMGFLDVFVMYFSKLTKKLSILKLSGLFECSLSHKYFDKNRYLFRSIEEILNNLNLIFKACKIAYLQCWSQQCHHFSISPWYFYFITSHLKRSWIASASFLRFVKLLIYSTDPGSATIFLSVTDNFISLLPPHLFHFILWLTTRYFLLFLSFAKVF